MRIIRSIRPNYSPNSTVIYKHSYFSFHKKIFFSVYFGCDESFSIPTNHERILFRAGKNVPSAFILKFTHAISLVGTMVDERNRFMAVIHIEILGNYCRKLIQHAKSLLIYSLLICELEPKRFEVQN